MKSYDRKRKGKIMYCFHCHKKTRQISWGCDDKEIQQFDENKVIVSKLQFFVCKSCGEMNSRDRW